MADLWELMTEVNWLLILLIPVVGGILSIIGDRVGMKFAKRRVTLFGLRPRHTSSLLTACTGMIISLFVIVILAIVSDTVRTSLFSMQYIQRQIMDLTKNLQESRNEQEVSSLMYIEAQDKLTSKEEELALREAELLELQSRTDELRKINEELLAERKELEESVNNVRENLGRLQEGRIIAFADERVGQEVIPEGVTDENVALEYLERLNEHVRYEIARRYDALPSTVVIQPDEETFNNVKTRILAYDSRKVVRAQIASNITAGEPVGINYSVYESIQVFYENEQLLSRVIRNKISPNAAELVLNFMLRELNREAQRSGILNDPLTGMVGGIPANDFYDGVENISTAVAPFRITLLAANDIYSEGPVTVRISVDSSIDPGTIDPEEEEFPLLEPLREYIRNTLQGANEDAATTEE